MGIPGIQNLLCVGLTDGSDHITLVDTALHVIDTSIILNNRGSALREAQHILDHFHSVFSLILDVMDRQHRFNVTEFLFASVKNIQIYWDERCLPIVTMDDIRRIINIMQHFQNSFGKKGKPLSIVIIAIQSRTFKIIFIIQKVIYNAIIVGLKHATIEAAPGQKNR